MENNNLLFSIVIPAYNARNYIMDAINSIHQQTYSNYEIIIIDDNSQDGTYELLTSYLGEDTKLKLYKNTFGKGVSNARNMGLAKSMGDYILFLDADDYYSNNNLLQILSDNIVMSFPRTDILYFGYEESRYRNLIINSNNKYNIIEYSYSNIVERTICSTPRELKDRRVRFASCWAKCYSNNFLKNNLISFPSGIINSEDAIFNIRALSYNPIVKFLDLKAYYYWTNNSNSCHRFCPEIRDDFINISNTFVNETKKYVEKNYQLRVKYRLYSYIVKVLKQYYFHPNFSNYKSNDTLDDFLEIKIVKDLSKGSYLLGFSLYYYLISIAIRYKLKHLIRFLIVDLVNLYGDIRKFLSTHYKLRSVIYQ